MSPTVQQLIGIRSSLAKAIEKYYLALIEKAEHTPWGTGVRASAIEIPARVLKEDTRPERDRRPKRERDEDDREDSRDWRPQMDPAIAALYEQPKGDKEEAPWEQERLNLQCAVILGAPGGGKTFLTQATALALAKRGREEWKERSTPLDQLPLPIRLDLNDLASESGSDDLLDILPPLVSKNHKLPALEPWLRRNLKADNCWLIFDALDQVDSDHMVGLTRRLESIRDWKCHALITCRKANYNRVDIPWTTITEYELAPFDATEIAAFITRWHEEKDGRGEKLNEVVGRSYSLQQACGTPLMLTLACLANEEEALTEETRRMDLYWMVLRGILRNAWREPRLQPTDPRIDDLLRMLRPMAWRLFIASPSVNQFPNSRVVEAIEVGANAAKLTDPVLGLRGELVERGVLVDAGVVRGEGQFSFLHRSFQEFLVAEYLGREVDARGWEAIRPLLDKKSWAPEWQEVIVLLAGMLKDPAPLLEMLRLAEKDDLFRHRLALAAQCMGELSAEVECKELFNNVTAQAWECYWKRAKTGTEAAIQPIVRALPALAKVDGEIRPHLRLLVHMTELLREPDRFVGDRATEALGRMGSAAAHPDVLNRLVELLWGVRAYVAAETAGKMGPAAARKDVVDWLVESLRGYPWAQSRAAEALGLMGPVVARPDVLDRLVDCLRNSDSNVRSNAEFALGRMEPVARMGILDRLVERLQDPDWYTWASDALGRMGPAAARKDVVDRLAELVRHPYKFVRASAKSALGRMGRAASPKVLDRPLEAREEVLDRMVERLRDPDRNVRSRTAKAVGEMGPAAARKDVVNSLVDLLLDSDAGQDPAYALDMLNVRSSAADALGRMGLAASRLAVVSRLLEWLQQPVESRHLVVEVLKSLGPAVAHPVVVDRLVDLLQDLSVISSAEEVLVSIGPVAARPEVVDRLVGLLQVPGVVGSALEVLVSLGPAAARPEVVALLVNWVLDSDVGRQSHAAHLLGRMMNFGARFFREQQGSTIAWVKDLSRYESTE